MYVTEAKLRSNLYLTALPPGSPERATGKAAGGAEPSVSPVGCSPKAKARRKRSEQGSTGHGSAVYDHCELDRTSEASRPVGGSSRPPCAGSRIHA